MFLLLDECILFSLQKKLDFKKNHIRTMITKERFMNDISHFRTFE